MKGKKLRLPCWSVILLIVLLFIEDCKAVKSIQRRFMWKQMDDTMDGLFDSMASSARAMKNMFGDFMPGLSTTASPLVIHSNVLDYLPSETTKIKYIIRGTSTHKPMKIIKMSAPKKVVKIMTIPKAIVENNLTSPKSNFPSTEALRQLEKEQEMIAEGRLPQHDVGSSNYNDDIVKGNINEFNNGWKPVSTQKPYAMSELHTSVVGEPLPEPEKIIYEPQANEVSYDYHKQKKDYEVTEHTPEETIAIPYAQTHYQNSRGFVPMRGKQSQHQSHQPHQHHNARVGLTHSATSNSSTTSTTESPNYPSSFLKKERERPSSLLKQHLRNLGVNDSNVALVNSKPKALQHSHGKSEKWPIVGPTLFPTSIELSTSAKVYKAEPLIQPTSKERLRPKTTKEPSNSKPRDIRQRGSIKFGDKLSELYK